MTELSVPKEKTVVQVGVRALVERVLRSGDLEAGFVGSGRALDGIRAHQTVQRMRPAQYQPEVPVSLKVSTERFVLTVSGRIDGVLTDEARPVVEEIKTTARRLDDVTPSPVHWGQARVYAHLYACQMAPPSVTVRLTYYQLDSGVIREFEEQQDPEGLEQFFTDLVGRYLDWAGVQADWKAQRRASIEALDFPFSRYRPGQRAMAVAVYRALVGRSRLLVQASTGIGKTMAAIFPAVKALGGEGIDRIFYLTARTTGRLVAEKAFNALRAGGLALKVLTLTAKDRVCFNPDSACHPDECEYARGFYDRLDGAVEALFSREAFTRPAIEAAARHHRICPFEFSLEMALWSDAIVCDYNYAFDPRVYLRRFFGDNGGDSVFLVDEAHNLVDRSREMFSAEIRKQAFLDTRREIGKALPGIYRLLGRINARLVRARKESAAAGGWQWAAAAPEDLVPLLRDFLAAAERWLVKNLPTPFRPALLDLYFAVSGFIRVSERYNESYATCYEQLGKDLRVKLFCMDPSGQMADALDRCRSAVFFSATLTPFDYYQALFGCRDSAHTLCLPSPFPMENLGLLVLGTISTLYRDRERTASAVCSALVALVRHRRGNTMFYFPSYAYLKMIYEMFSSDCPEVETLVQTPSMGEVDKEAFLERFARDNPESLVGFVVMGGIFGEGIDLVGDRLSAAAVIGAGLPGITPEQELIRGYFDDHSGEGFAYAYQFPGFTRVLQAAGRVIRTGKDRGVVLLIDRRFATLPYARLFPGTWQPRAVKNPEQIEQCLSRFWSAEEGNSSP
ncbi:MAG: ATP-dependent DNA helicase [Desulfobacterales bacterium]|nr:ATP-dependent DNA helicase [Desulfobacterales bacterium]